MLMQSLINSLYVEINLLLLHLHVYEYFRAQPKSKKHLNYTSNRYNIIPTNHALQCLIIHEQQVGQKVKLFQAKSLIKMQAKQIVLMFKGKQIQ